MKMITGSMPLGPTALLSLAACALMAGTSPARAASAQVQEALSAYDTAITADTPAPVARLESAVTLDGTAGVPFDFGGTFGDVTMEFVIQGDPEATGGSGYLAVGENTGYSLRYEQYQNTRQLGFTQSGVADYLFTPAVPSPIAPTHITYVLSLGEAAMKLYTNGVLAGTTSDIYDFALPTGPGFLGQNAAGTEPMVGTIHRVTVYQDVLPEAKIRNHGTIFAALKPPTISSFTATPAVVEGGASSVLNWSVQDATTVLLNGAAVTGTGQTVSPAATTTYTLLAANDLSTNTVTVTVTVTPPLGQYDAAIAADTTPAPIVVSTNIVTLTGSGGEPFDFGATSEDVTMEFILEGDPVSTGDSGYLAVGENTGSNLRYDQWQDQRKMGFTQLGVADYMFNPSIPSPTVATHVVYVWNTTDRSMTLYANGISVGTVTGVSDQWAMPTGQGFLGANPGGGEAMVGTIFRVVIYDEMLSEADIKAHADAFTSAQRPAIISSFTATPAEIVGQGSATLNWQVENATSVQLDGVDVTGSTSQTVSPTVSTVYTLVATNNISSVSARATVLVTPDLTAYDAAITADAPAPVAKLTTPVVLSGSAVPFDFGPTSGDATIEFILEGDPIATGDSGYLAVGEIPTSSLRYDLWPDTRQLGFTQSGVADYMFTPEVPSPTVPTHVAYVWNPDELTMRIYINGVLAGSNTAVSDQFVMPSGAGFLGATATGAETMIGRILRITVYDEILSDAAIQRHGSTLPVPAQEPSLAISVTGGQPTLTLTGVAGTHYRVEYRDSLAAADSWQLLQDIPSLTGTSITVNDSTSTAGRTARFYRAVVAQ
ncbi:MAG: LamG-like jellyroll fold domain-containing protein [Verrucomicrobiia bacterium]